MRNEALFKVVQGDCLHIDVQPRDDQDQPYDLTLVKVEIGVRWPSEDPGAGGQWMDDTDNGVTVSADGIISGVVPAAITEQFPAGVETFVQIRITPAGGCPQTLLYSAIRVHRAAL